MNESRRLYWSRKKLIEAKSVFKDYLSEDTLDMINARIKSINNKEDSFNASRLDFSYIKSLEDKELTNIRETLLRERDFVDTFVEEIPELAPNSTLWKKLCSFRSGENDIERHIEMITDVIITRKKEKEILEGMKNKEKYDKKENSSFSCDFKTIMEGLSVLASAAVVAISAYGTYKEISSKFSTGDSETVNFNDNES